MKYTQSRFTVPVSEGSKTMCDEKGHSAADSKGRCLCCGESVVPTLPERVAIYARARTLCRGVPDHYQTVDA